MTEIKDKLVSMELLKVYHDYNISTYATFVLLAYENGVVKNAENEAMSYEDIYSLATNNAKCIRLTNGNSTMLCADASASSVDFADLHEKEGKCYIGWLTIGSDNRVTYKESAVALNGDVIKNLSEMVDDSGHRTVSDTQIETWDNKSEFSGSWNDLTDKPIATVEQTKSFLGLSQVG